MTSERGGAWIRGECGLGGRLGSQTCDAFIDEPKPAVRLRGGVRVCGGGWEARGLEECVGQLRGGPLVPIELTVDAAEGVDDDRAEVMAEAAVLAGDGEVEGWGHGGEGLGGDGSEEPTCGIAASVGGGVAFEHGGAIELGIEGQAQELPVGGGVGLLEDEAAGVGEMPGHARAELGEGAAGEEEREGQGAASERGDAEGLPVFIDEGEIGHGIARFELGDGWEWRGRGGGKGLALAGRADLFDPVLVGGGHERELDLVAGGEPGQLGGIAHIELHGHAGHIARDFLMADDGVALVWGDFSDDAAGREFPAIRRGGWGWGSGGAAAGEEEGQEEGEEEGEDFGGEARG